MIQIKAHNINQIMGSPLVALVEAERQSALATMEFIRDIGFYSCEESSPNEKISIGKMRTITFCYEKCNREGKMQKFKMEIPLLSLIQIPVLKIKDAKIKYGIKIIATTRLKKVKKRRDIDNKIDSTFEDILNVKGFIAPNSSKSSKHPSESHMEVSMNLEQGDLPLGVITLLNTANDTIKIVTDLQEN